MPPARAPLTLALETSGDVGSVALRLEDGTILERVFPEGTSHGTGLFPACRDLLEVADREVAEVGLIAVSQGPGSFTGLRVGVAAAKGIAYALGCDVLGISTLDILAQNARTSSGGVEVGSRIVPVLDARRGHVHAALYSLDEQGIIRRSEDLVVPPDRLTSTLEHPCVLLGDGVRRYPELVVEGVRALPEERWRARAAVVAELAVGEHATGRRDPVHELVPLYRRLSTPEERRLEGRSPS